MNEMQRKQVVKFRELGLGYMHIAKKLELPLTTVKNFCRRTGLGGFRGYKQEGCCKQCGKVLPTNKKTFCSIGCQNKWWYLHADIKRTRARHTYECHICHKKFTVTYSAKRKYCSRECYVLDRFGGGKHENS